MYSDLSAGVEKVDNPVLFWGFCISFGLVGLFLVVTEFMRLMRLNAQELREKEEEKSDSASAVITETSSGEEVLSEEKQENS